MCALKSLCFRATFLSQWIFKKMKLPTKTVQLFFQARTIRFPTGKHVGESGRLSILLFHSSCLGGRRWIRLYELASNQLGSPSGSLRFDRVHRTGSWACGRRGEGSGEEAVI